MQMEDLPTYGLLAINHAYTEGKLTFSEWLELSLAWAEAVIRQFGTDEKQAASWYNMDTNSAPD
jgi:hypothetical protein